MQTSIYQTYVLIYNKHLQPYTWLLMFGDMQ